MLVKDPDSHKGLKVIIYAVVTQFDAATGKSAFRAATGADSGDYEQNTIIEAHDPKILANVVQKDTVTRCAVQGSYTYKSQTGGELTVPKFWVNIIKDTGPI
jgi:hypothetical protein